jgi:GTPase
MRKPENQTRCGYVAIVGRPNVGKSTLLNRLIGQKISITSRKAQTTRHQILGVCSTQDYQIIYVDTPGLHLRRKKAMNQYMNRAARAALSGVDLIVLVIEGTLWKEEDDYALEQVKAVGLPTILVINKIDKVKNKLDLLAQLQQLQQKMDFLELIPVCAKTGEHLSTLEATIIATLPHGPFLFPADQLTDRNMQFMASEIVREKIFRFTGQELPYESAVIIEQFEELEKLCRISALIYVETDGQKKIIIGKKGEKLKQIGTQARKDLEEMLEKKVFLQLWVKVKSGWADDVRALQSFGYIER